MLFQYDKLDKEDIATIERTISDNLANMMAKTEIKMFRILKDLQGKSKKIEKAKRKGVRQYIKAMYNRSKS